MTFRILPSLSSSVEKRHYRLRGVKTDSQHGGEVASGGGVLVRATLRIIRCISTAWTGLDIGHQASFFANQQRCTVGVAEVAPVLLTTFFKVSDDALDAPVA